MGRLVRPSPAYRESFLAGERADYAVTGDPADWLDAAEHDFEAFLADRVRTRIRWGVPSTYYWWIVDDSYVGTLIVRHHLTPELSLVGGHIGYHVVAPCRRRGEATRMLAAALPLCTSLGLDRVLLTCRSDNVPSQRVIRANGGVYAGTHQGEDRYWIPLQRF